MLQENDQLNLEKGELEAVVNKLKQDLQELLEQNKSLRVSSDHLKRWIGKHASDLGLVKFSSKEDAQREHGGRGFSNDSPLSRGDPSLHGARDVNDRDGCASPPTSPADVSRSSPPTEDINADVYPPTADVSADVSLTTADNSADVSLATSDNSADVSLTTADVSADVSLTTSDNSADVSLTTSDNSADVSLTTSDNSADGFCQLQVLELGSPPRPDTNPAVRSTIPVTVPARAASPGPRPASSLPRAAGLSAAVPSLVLVQGKTSQPGAGDVQAEESSKGEAVSSLTATEPARPQRLARLLEGQPFLLAGNQAVVFIIQSGCGHHVTGTPAGALQVQPMVRQVVAEPQQVQHGSISGRGQEDLHRDVGKTREDLHRDVGKTREDLHRDVGKTREDLHRDVGKTRVDLHRDVGKTREDLHRDVGKTREDLHRDVGKTREDLHRDVGKTREDLHKDVGKTREDLHKDVEETQAAGSDAQDATSEGKTTISTTSPVRDTSPATPVESLLKLGDKTRGLDKKPLKVVPKYHSLGNPLPLSVVSSTTTVTTATTAERKAASSYRGIHLPANTKLQWDIQKLMKAGYVVATEAAD